MKRSAFLPSVFLFISFSIFAQPKKGDKEIAFSTSFTSGNSGELLFNENNEESFRANFNYGQMLNDQVMIGSGIQVFNSSGESLLFSGDDKLQRYSLTPFARYYFHKRGRLAAFGFVNSRIGHFNYQYELSSFPDNKGWSGHAEGGLGAQYFIAPNVAAHAEIGTVIFETKNQVALSNFLFAKFGLRTFLHDRADRVAIGPDRYLKKGNFVWSGSAQITANPIQKSGDNTLMDEKSNNLATRVSFNPGLKYFVNNRLATSFNVGYSGIWTGYYSDIDYSISAGIEAFTPLGKNVFLVPALNITSNPRHAKYYTTAGSISPIGGAFVLDTIVEKTSSVLLTGRADLGIKYFASPNSIVTVGGYYSLSHYRQDTSYTRGTQSFGGYAALEHFFAKNVSWAVAATYAKGESNLEYEGFFPFIDSSEFKQLSLRFSIQYFVFR